jgi:hypothetical protein
LGRKFKVECWIDDVLNLSGQDIQIRWDSTIIKYVNHTATSPVETYPSGTLHSPVYWVRDDVDESGNLESQGAAPGTMYWLVVGDLEPISPFNGSGIAFIMTFQAVALGNTWINFTYTALGDPEGFFIAHNSENTTISVTNPPPEISSVKFNGTSPYPYTHAAFIRPNEPVKVTANITYWNSPSLTKLCYRTDSSSWWNTTMSYNSTSNLWQTIIPGQSGDSTVEFFIIATDTHGYSTTSSTYSYHVRPLLLGDVNGDGKVDILDVVLITGHYGERYP